LRIRVRFSKVGKVRWTSHRDVARMWERAFRRIGLPVAYTGGFAPRPKVSFGLALPTGGESEAEYLDVEVDRTVDVDGLAAALSAALPAGIDVHAVALVATGENSLQQDVTSCTWQVELAGVDVAEAEGLVAAALAAETLPSTRERKGRQVTDDLRPAIWSLAVDVPTDRGVALVAELATQPRGVRPRELVDVVAPGRELGLVRRINQWMQRDGAAREEPLPLDATGARRDQHVRLPRAGAPPGGAAGIPDPAVSTA
jgi:radical SAM-linked protein